MKGEHRKLPVLIPVSWMKEVCVFVFVFIRPSSGECVPAQTHVERAALRSAVSYISEPEREAFTALSPHSK